MAENPLGRVVPYPDHYSPELLLRIPRQDNRSRLGLTAVQLPFTGMDFWHAYELSWLTESGKPRAAILRMTVPCDSEGLVESKSFKLYLNSFNLERLADERMLLETIRRDLEPVLGIPPGLELLSLDEAETLAAPDGTCLDSLEIGLSGFRLAPERLVCEDGPVEEHRVYSHLFRSNCPITGQPDWATVNIRYLGRFIDPAGLLEYLVSFRCHDDYHENCVERIFRDIQARCSPEALCITARFTRRGGIDINPCRSSRPDWLPENLPRLVRQ